MVFWISPLFWKAFSLAYKQYIYIYKSQRNVKSPKYEELVSHLISVSPRTWCLNTTVEKQFSIIPFSFLLGVWVRSQEVPILEKL